MSTSKAILLIAYAFPPFAGGSVQRNLKFCKHIQSFGWDAVVLTCSNCGVVHQDQSMLKEVEHIRTHRVTTGLIYKKRENLIQRILSRLYLYISYLFTEDVGWIPQATLAGINLVREHNLKYIYASGNPFGTFITGWLISLCTGKKLIVDYRDSWSFSEYEWSSSKVSKLFDRFWEKIILKHAARVVVVKPKMVQELDSLVPGVREKIHLITNGFDDEDFQKLSKITFPKKTIVFTGMLWQKAGHHNVMTFLDALSEIENGEIDFLIYGDVDDYYKNKIKERKYDHFVRIMGYVNHQQAVAAQVSADIILLLIEAEGGMAETNKYNGIIPGKIFEYLASQSKILAVVPSGGFEEQTILESGAGVVARPGDKEDIKKKIRFLLESDIKLARNEKFISQFSRKNLTRKLTDLLNSIDSSQSQ